MEKRKTGFKIYIDESGCGGFKFAPNGKHDWSSLWFVISAVIVRTDNEYEQVCVIDEIREQLGKNRDFTIHFRDLKHEQKALAAELVGTKRFRTVSIAIFKPALANPEAFNERYRLYFYATRYLLERVSWFCRDTRLEKSHKAEVIFSNRAGMKYSELKDYLDNLMKHHANGSLDVRIDWSVIDTNLIRSEQHKKMKGLQVADIVASSTFYSLHHNRYGMTEVGYLQRLRKIAYRHKGSVSGYGLKIWPHEVVTSADAAAALAVLSTTKK